eukprot:scaffold42270_cov30-Tisochrysis_lutea.AAC.4
MYTATPMAAHDCTRSSSARKLLTKPVVAGGTPEAGWTMSRSRCRRRRGLAVSAAWRPQRRERPRGVPRSCDVGGAGRGLSRCHRWGLFGSRHDYHLRRLRPPFGDHPHRR